MIEVKVRPGEWFIESDTVDTNDRINEYLGQDAETSFQRNMDTDQGKKNLYSVEKSVIAKLVTSGDINIFRAYRRWRPGCQIKLVPNNKILVKHKIQRKVWSDLERLLRLKKEIG